MGFLLINKGLSRAKSANNKKKHLLNTMYNFYIELDPNWNNNKDTIRFGGKQSYLVTDIFDTENKKLVPDSPFISLLEKNWLGRLRK